MNLDLTDGDYTLAFRQLFHIFHGTQQHDGGYAGKRICINDDELRRHLTGEIAYGFCVTTKLQNGSTTLARFTALDIDRQFRERLPIFSTVLHELGCQRASCTTPGSNPDKGKIIICFDRMVPRHNAYDLGMLVLQKAREKAPTLIPASPKDGDVEVYPKSPASRADGGLLRICGRNIARSGPLETLRDLDFKPLDPAQIVPLREGQVAYRARKYTRVAAAPNEPAWVSRLVNEPWTWASFGGRMGQRRKLTALAHYCDGDESRYIRFLERICDRSPALDEPSPKTKDKRNPIRREIAELSAWRNAQASSRWRPAAAKNAVYEAMVGFVRERGLREHCFGMTTRELARRMGCAQSTAATAADKAEDERLIVRLDRGSANSEYTDCDGKRNVKRGLLSLWGLPGAGETIYDVFASALADPMYTKRIGQSKAITPMSMRLCADAVVAKLQADFEADNDAPEAGVTPRAA